jgi:hypothetical protein
MRNPAGGVYSNFKDSDSSDPVYLYGHHVTAEHVGLLLWVSAALLEHKTFEETYQYLVKTMVSPKTGLIYWAIDKKTGTAHIADPKDPTPYGNTPFDDFRVVKGLIAGFTQWRDDRYLKAAVRTGRGLRDYCVTDAVSVPKYPAGLVSTGYGWSETTSSENRESKLIPINYGDLWAMKWLAGHDARWDEVIKETANLMQKGVAPSGELVYNCYKPAKDTFSGDWEYQPEEGSATIAGEKMKTIQDLWTAIHLVRIGKPALPQKVLGFFKQKYLATGFVSEYYNFDGTPCVEAYFDETRKKGEARIYSQLVRLSYYLGDTAFGDKVVAEKLVTDQDTKPGSPTYGSIGVTTAAAGDADAWNTLEALLGLAIQKKSSVLIHTFKDGA